MKVHRSTQISRRGERKGQKGGGGTKRVHVIDALGGKFVAKAEWVLLWSFTDRKWKGRDSDVQRSTTLAS